MSRRRLPGKNSRPRRSDALLEKALTALFVGLVVLGAPLLFSGNPILNAVLTGLRLPALLVVVVGLVLLVIDVWNRKPARSVAKVTALPSITTPQSNGATNKSEQQVSAPHVQSQPIALASWSEDVLAQIEWRRFEALVESLFAQAGFETRSQSHGADGGVDIWLHSKRAEGPVAVVQCKHWKDKPVGVKEIREFLGVMVAHKLKRGTYATSSSFTKDALSFAQANGINAQDGNGLLRMIRSRTPEQQTALLAVATEGEYWRPTCASCGTKMVERTPKTGGAAFWGCANFPKCRTRLPMRNAVRREPAGTPLSPPSTSTHRVTLSPDFHF